MKYFHHIAQNIDVKDLVRAIDLAPELWNVHSERKGSGSPHLDMSDIWLRYNHPDNKGPDFHKEHDSVWYPAYYMLPQARSLIFGVMALVDGERLGGVIITKIPSGGRIAPHIDQNWHVDYYDKFYLSLRSAPGANFYCGDEFINPKPGDLYLFDNRVEHWVENDSPSDRMTLIICIRRNRGTAPCS